MHLLHGVENMQLSHVQVEKWEWKCETFHHQLEMAYTKPIVSVINEQQQQMCQWGIDLINLKIEMSSNALSNVSQLNGFVAFTSWLFDCMITVYEAQMKRGDLLDVCGTWAASVENGNGENVYMYCTHHHTPVDQCKLEDTGRKKTKTPRNRNNEKHRIENVPFWIRLELKL